MPISSQDLQAALAKLPKIAAQVEKIVLASGFRGVISAADAAALQSASGFTAAQLAFALRPVAQLYAVTPISKFNVGAVAVGKSGALYFGANLEVSGQALSFTLHAEQAATSNAWLNGETGLDALAVSAAPCGYCRQFLYELIDASKLTIVLPDASQQPTQQLLTTYLPSAFGPADLGKTGGLMQSENHGLTVASRDATVVKALEAANASYSPYTCTFAGVALKTSDGSIFTGRYAENAAFNPSLSPLAAALSQLALSGHSVSDITEAVLVQKAGDVDQSGATELILKTVSSAPLTKYTATR